MSLTPHLHTFPMTLPSIIQLVATIEKHPIYLRNQWWMTTATLRLLAIAINQPNPKLLRLNKRPNLAAHLTILQLLNLITHHDGTLRCTHHLRHWLAQPPDEQLVQLQSTLDASNWQSTAAHWHSERQFTIALYAR